MSRHDPKVTLLQINVLWDAVRIDIPLLLETVEVILKNLSLD